MNAAGNSRTVLRGVDEGTSTRSSNVCSPLRMTWFEEEGGHMKFRRYLSTIALLCAACACAPAALAQTAHGSYQFAHDDGRTKYVEFEASAQSSGGASAYMFFSDDTVIAEQDTDGVGDPVETYPVRVL